MSLGSLIEKARKDAGISIDELAASTNLRTSMIQEIEKNNFSLCGGDTYARGHVHNIAKSLDIDPKEFLRIFDEEQGSQSRTMQALLLENNVMRRPDGRRKISWRTLVLISIISLGIAAAAQIIISNHSTSSSVLTLESPKPAQTSAPTQSASPAPTQSAAASAQSSFSSGTGVEVVLTATRAKSWLLVSDASGRTLFSAEVPLGASKNFSSDLRLDLRVGNAGGVDVQVNGKKRSVLGANGEVVSVSYGVNS